MTTDKWDFKSSSVLFLKNVLLYILAMAPLLSFCLMGMQWFLILFTIVLASLPFVLAAGLLVSRTGRFSFDDEQQRIVVPLGKAISYQSIKRITINETGGMLQVHAKLGLLNQVPLSYAMDARDRPRLLEHLLRRFPQAAIRERRHGDWKAIAVIALMIVLTSVGFHVYLYHTSAEIMAIPRQVIWTTKWAGKNAMPHRIGNFDINLPGRVQLTGRGENTLQFEDGKTRTEMKFVAPPAPVLSGFRASFIRYATGIRNNYDMLHVAYSARVGVIPLALKGMALTGLSNVVIYDIRLISSRDDGEREKSAAGKPSSQQLKGFLTQGENKGQETASLVLTNEEGGPILYVFFTGPNRLEEKKLRAFISGVRVAPGQ